MAIPPDHIVTDIDWLIDQFHMSKRRVTEYLPARNPWGYRGLAGTARNIGQYKFAVGDTSNAQEWFARAATYFEQFILGDREARRETGTPPPPEVGTRGRNLLHAALLVDEETAQKAAAVVAGIDPACYERHPELAAWYHYPIALAALIQGDPEVARDALINLQESVGQLENNQHYLAFATVLEGYLTEDSELVVAGIKEKLAFHQVESNNPPQTAGDFVDFDALGLYLYGLRNGYDLEIDDERIPTELAWKLV